MAFLFDRLLPAYHIREDHYDIEAYYKWTLRIGRNSRYAFAPKDMEQLKYLVWTLRVIRADEKDVRHVETCLDVIKAIGIVLAIFLVAAINALVSH